MKVSDKCPACGKQHPPVLIIPLVVWNPEKKKPVRMWQHADPRLN